MDITEAIKARHSVRSFTDQRIEGAVLDELRQTIAACNEEGDLNIQLRLNEPTAFNSMMAHYGKFQNVNNYIALVGKKSASLEEKCGYYSEKIVLRAQQLGLNTCWVAATFSKGKAKNAIQIAPGEKLLMVIALGYGTTDGAARKTKPLEALCRTNGLMPEWFRRGMEAVQLAPTAMNQQKFLFTLDGDRVSAASGSGFYTKTDLGIAKYHFEVAAGADGWRWAD